MRRYEVLMIEDSPDEAHALEEHLERFGKERGILFSVDLRSTALEFMGEHVHADLVFLDIDLPGISGMEAAEQLRTYDQQTPLIFVTNLAQYAVRGYQVDALDFMVKPVSYPDFSLRMGRALRVMERNSSESITVAAVGGTERVPLSDIVFVETQGHDLAVHRASRQEPLRLRSSIRKARAALPEKRFIQTSQSCICSMEHVRAIRDDTLEMDTGDVLYMSRSRKKACLQTLGRFFGGTI